MNNDLVLIYSGFFICAIVLSFMLNAIFLRFFKTLGIRSAELIRWSSMHKPSLGGISFFVIFLISVTCYGIFFRDHPVEHKDTFSGIFDTQTLGLLSAVTLAFVMGLADDAYNTKPLLKLVVQIACGTILVLTGQSIRLFENAMLNDVLTIVWVVAIMNSINMLDNMDAITATVSLFIVVQALLYLYITKDFYNIHVIILLGLTGALSGFLFFNWHPSKIFMGDTGSQFLGIILAIIGIHYFWNSHDFGGNYFHTKQVIVTVLAFLVPVCDTATVVINRLLRRQPPWVGGKDHTTHFLSYLGLSDSQVALAFTGISVVSTMLIFVIQGTIVHWGMKHILIFGAWIVIVFGTLFTITKIRKAPQQQDEPKDTTTA